MKLIFFVCLIFIVCHASNLDQSSPSCSALLNLYQSLPNALKIPSSFKLLKQSDFQIKVSVPLDLGDLVIPIKIRFYFNSEGKLVYKQNPTLKEMEKYSTKYKDPDIAIEIIKKTIKLVAISSFESILKEGLKTKIGFSFPHLAFFIAIEEIMNIYKPLLTKKNGLENIEYFYQLGGNKIVARVGIKIKFNYSLVKEIIGKLENNLGSFIQIWKKQKHCNNDLINLVNAIKERIFHLKWNLANVLNNKDYKGQMILVTSEKLGRSILIDKEIYQNLLKELQSHVLTNTFKPYLSKLKDFNTSTMDWYKVLLSELSPKAREYAKNHIRFLYESGKMALLSAKGHIKMADHKYKRKIFSSSN